MKKIFVVLSSLMLVASAANAQSFLESLKGIAGGVLNQVVATTSSVDMAGSWTYQGCAIGAASNDIVTSIAASAGSATIEAKADAALAKIGIKKGVANFTFNTDGTFTFSFGRINLPGTWTKTDNTLTMNFSKLLNVKLTGTVKATTSGCEILFNSDKFIDFVKKVISVAGKLTANSLLGNVESLIANVDGIQLGFKLSK